MVGDLTEKERLILRIRDVSRHLNYLQKQFENPASEKEKHVKSILDSMCQTYPCLESQIHKRLKMSYDDVKATIEDLKKSGKQRPTLPKED